MGRKHKRRCRLCFFRFLSLHNLIKKERKRMVRPAPSPHLPRFIYSDSQSVRFGLLEGVHCLPVRTISFFCTSSYSSSFSCCPGWSGGVISMPEIRAGRERLVKGTCVSLCMCVVIFSRSHPDIGSDSGEC